MSYTYQIHPLVEKDFEEGYIWYEEKQKGLGEDLLMLLMQKSNRYYRIQRRMVQEVRNYSGKLK